VVILAQGEKPNHLYFILNGICKVKKKSKKIEILSRLLSEARQKAEKHDTGYKFHYRLRNSINQVNDLSNDNIKQFCSVRQVEDPNETLTHITVSELDRHIVGEEIAQLEHLVAREEAAEAKEAIEIANLLKQPGKQEQVKRMQEKKYCEIDTLYWPRFFGEACVLQPDDGTCLGTVYAETACDLLLIHKSQLQTFYVGENLIARVKDRCVKYPNDQEIMRSLEKNKKWTHYRKEMMDKISKSKWPHRPDDLEPFLV
jgi:hypothetical protein